MTQLSYYVVDAFAARPFTGNAAGVYPLERRLPDETMQAIAGENNLSETAFFVSEKDDLHLRWFTPTTEVPLCGHATLASAFVAMTYLWPGLTVVRFETRSGPLTVRRDGELFELDLPLYMPTQSPAIPAELERALGVRPVELFETAEDKNYYVLLDDEAAGQERAPGTAALAPGRGAPLPSRRGPGPAGRPGSCLSGGDDPGAVAGSSWRAVVRRGLRLPTARKPGL